MGIVNESSPSIINNDSSISTILNSYSNHPSVSKMKESLKINPNSFKFNDTNGVDVMNATNDVELSKGVACTTPLQNFVYELLITYMRHNKCQYFPSQIKNS